MFYTGNHLLNPTRSKSIKNYNARSLDAITRQWTAFSTFDDLMKSVRDHGYVPTIRDEQPHGLEYKDWDNHPFRWDKERLRKAIREAGGKVYPELDRPWDGELHMHDGVGYTYRMSELRMPELKREIKKRKQELGRVLRRQDASSRLALHFPAECEVLACDAKGERLDAVNVKCYYNPMYTESTPTKRDLRHHLDEYMSYTHFLYLSGQAYWIDRSLPMADWYEYSEPTGEYWGLTIWCL